MTIVSIPCLRCSEPFDNNSRHPSHYCKLCRKVQKLERDNVKRRRVREDQEILRAVAESMRGYLDPSMYATVEDFVTGLGVIMDSDKHEDRMPVGSNLPAGPDEGMSTTYDDLAEQLDSRRLEVIMHDWFKEHPHWTVGMHDS